MNIANSQAHVAIQIMSLLKYGFTGMSKNSRRDLCLMLMELKLHLKEIFSHHGLKNSSGFELMIPNKCFAFTVLIQEVQLVVTIFLSKAAVTIELPMKRSKGLLQKKQQNVILLLNLYRYNGNQCSQ